MRSLLGYEESSEWAQHNSCKGYTRHVSILPSGHDSLASVVYLIVTLQIGSSDSILLSEWWNYRYKSVLSHPALSRANATRRATTSK